MFFGKSISKTHDLIFLINQLKEELPELQTFKELLEEIVHFGVEIRYPDFEVDPTIEETKAAPQTVLDIRTIVMAKILL